MPYLVSFECSQKLTPQQLALFRNAIEAVLPKVVATIKDTKDVPEYFYTDLTQKEIV